MATDVIIDPANGQIYWNDGTGSPQSISIGGNAQDTISITGYGAAFSPGSTPAQSSAGVLVKFTDLATGTLTPGTNAYELGSGALRWKFFGTTTNISDNSSALGTNTFSLLTGLVQVNGGIAISGNAGIGQTLFIFNSTDPRYFTGFRSSASLASTQIYTLPLTYPSTGSSVLQSDTAGTLTWVPMTASSPGGSGNTAQNINIVNATTGVFYPLFTNTSSTASGTAGVAVSVDANLSFDSASNTLIVDGLTLGGSGATTTLPFFEIGNTSAIAQTLNFATTGTGAKQFNFGTSSASASTATFFGSVTANYVIYNTGSSGVLRIQTDAANSRVRMFENMTTSGTLGFFGTSGGTLYLGTDSGTSNGDITIRGNFTTGGGGNQRAAIFTLATATSNGTGVGGTMVFQTSTSSTSGSATNALRTRLRIEGAATGTSNLESIIILGDATSGTAWSSYIRGVDASGTDIEAGEIQIQAGRSTGTGAARGISFYVSPSSTTSSTINAASQIARFSSTGLTIYPVTNTTSTTTGALVVAGGVGIGGSIFLGNQLTQTFNPTTGAGSDHAVFLQSNPLPTAVGAIVQVGFGTAWDGSTAGFFNGSPNGTWLGISAATANTADFLNFQENGTSRFTVGAGGTTRIWSSVNSTSSTSGALIVSGGFGLASNAFIGGTTNITNNTSSINSGTGALVVTGGVGIVGNAFIGGTFTITNTTSSAGNSTGAFVVYGGTNIGGNAFIGGTTRVLSTTASTSTGSGAFVVAGGAGVAGSLYVGTNVVVGALTYAAANVVGAFQSSVNSYNQFILQNSNNGSSASADFVLNNDLSTDSAYYTNLGMNSSGWAATTSPFNTANASYLTATTGDLVLGTTTANAIRIGTGSTIFDTININAAGTAVSITPATASGTTSTGALTIFGGVGIGGSVNIGKSLNLWNPAYTFYTGLASGAATSSITYILPPGPPNGLGTSVLSSSNAGVLSWIPQSSGGSGSPGGTDTAIQFNDASAFGGTSGGFSFTKTTHTVSIGSTNQLALTSIGLQLYNNNASTISQTVRWSPGMEFMGRAYVTVPGTDFRVRFLEEVQTTTNSYAQKLVWRFSYDTGTPSYTNPLLIMNSQNGMGIGATDQTAVTYLKAGNQGGTDLSYVLPIAYPTGTGTSYLSASTTGVMSWVAAPSGGGGTPGGSNKQIQYNSSSTFAGASGFEYVTGGIANTVSIFSASGTGYTGGLWINAINGSTTRVGIGLSNPQYELEILGEISATNKSFVIDHPTKEGMKLRYGSLEGPENGVYVRGILKGTNIIETPDHWTGLVDPESFTVTLTPIGRFAQLYVEKVEDYKVYIADNNMYPIHCYYTVWAERKDIPKLVTEY